jgi:hypothetical protein
MTLGVVSLALLLVAIGVPGAVVLALAPVAVCLSMVLLMTREGDVEAGLRRYTQSLDGKPSIRDNTPGEYSPTIIRTGK